MRQAARRFPCRFPSVLEEPVSPFGSVAETTLTGAVGVTISVPDRCRFRSRTCLEGFSLSELE